MKIDRGRMDALMRKAGFANYNEAAAAASERGIDISLRTLFNVAGGARWRSDTLEALCQLLDCKPGDLVAEWGELPYTHGTPQPMEEPQVA